MVTLPAQVPTAKAIWPPYFSYEGFTPKGMKMGRRFPGLPFFRALPFPSCFSDRRQQSHCGGRVIC